MGKQTARAKKVYWDRREFKNEEGGGVGKDMRRGV